MAVISNDTFDPLRRYIGVRLQQGVPIVDADWNEMDDIRKFELRAFLKWFVGDGVPAGNDGFRISGIGSKTTFTISSGGGGGTALAAGRLILDGIEVFITADLDFASQKLHASQAGSAALAAAWGVPVIAALPVASAPPGGFVQLAVYADVWERLVTTSEDPSLVLPGLGTESCARIRREWVVRVRKGTLAPKSGDPDFMTGHSYSLLSIVSQDSSGSISSIADLRRLGLVVPSKLDLQQIMIDSFGSSYSVDGTGTAKLSYPMRDVLNAMLKVEPAAVGPVNVFSGGPFIFPSAVIDSSGIPWLFWVRIPVPAAGIFVSFSRFIAGKWSPAQDAFQLTSALSVISLAAAAQPDGSLRVFYIITVTGAIGSNTPFFSRHFANGTWGAEETVTAAGGNSKLATVVDAAGTIFVAWQSVTGIVTNCLVRRYPLAGVPVDDNLGLLTASAGHALTVDPTGAAELVYVQTPNPVVPDWPILTRRFVAGAWEAGFTTPGITIPVQSFIDLTVSYSLDGSLRAYYATQGPSGGSRLLAKRLAPGVTEIHDLLPPGNTPRFPNYVVDSQGNAQLYFQNATNLQQISLVQKI